MGAGTSGNLSVTTAGGTANLAGFTFIPAPTISSFTSTSAASGTQVTISGTNLSGATAVSFGGTAASSFTVNSSTSITATVGLGTSGNVSVTTSGGTANLAGFSFISASTITSFTPSSAASGTQVIITGTNFSGATAVSFGGTVASSFTVDSPTSITATVGSGTSGTVSVTTAGGTANLAGFSFTPPPTIASYTPSSVAMGTQVTITGTNLGGATSVSFGGTAATSFTVNSSTIIATVGTGTSGNVSVTTVGGTANLGGFSFIPAPTITSFTPSSAAIGTQVTITGTNLSGVTSVSFGGTAASSFTVNSSTSITATVGSGNSGNVSVTTAGGMANLAGFGFIPAPTITSFTPSSAASGSQVTITGTNLSGATDVSFGGTAVTSFTVDSSTSITALVGAGTSRNVSVTTAGGTANLAGFTFIPAPTITSFTPSSAAIGTQVTITGTNLGGATAVSFGGSAASSFTVNSATSITATVGAGPGGDVTLITLNGTVSKSGFIYVPSIISNSSTTFKMGGSVILKEPTGSVPGYSYQWAKDGVDIPNATAPSYTAIESGSYAVSMVSGSTVSTSAPVLVKAVFKLPVNNFQIVSSGETCKTSNNGSFVITAGQPHNYNAVITGPNFNQTPAFVNNSLSVTGLLAGKYTACVTVSGQADYKQCFDIVVTEPEDLSVYTSIDQSENKIRLALKGGTNYNVEVNGTLFQTSNDEIYLPLSAGKNNLKVSTDQRCQGIIERVINVESRVLVYPNPFDKVLNLRLSNNVVQPAIVEIWTLDGKRAFIEKFINHYGILQLDLSSLRPGIYSMKLTVSNSESLYKIVKK